MLPADHWWTIAQSIIVAVENGYTTQGVTLPDRRLVVPGLPAWDFYEGENGLLAVQLERVFSYAGNIAAEVVEGNSTAPGFALRGGLYAINLLRCVPSIDDEGNAPSVASEEDAAQLILTDAQRLLNVLVDAVRAGDIGGCSTLAFQSWDAVTPSGGWGGGILRVRVGA